jgi:hypothetical protein
MYDWGVTRILSEALLFSLLGRARHSCSCEHHTIRDRLITICTLESDQRMNYPSTEYPSTKSLVQLTASYPNIALYTSSIQPHPDELSNMQTSCHSHQHFRDYFSTRNTIAKVRIRLPRTEAVLRWSSGPLGILSWLRRFCRSRLRQFDLARRTRHSMQWLGLHRKWSAGLRIASPEVGECKRMRRWLQL